MAFESLNTEFVQVNNRIMRLGTFGKPQEDFLESSIKEFIDSPVRKAMLKSKAYYGNVTDILEVKRTYIDRNGVAKENVNLSNTKLAHPFMRKLVNQKINYFLGTPPTFKTKSKDFGAIIKHYFNKQFYKKLNNVGREAITKGIAWIQVYYNKDNQLTFKRIPSEEIIAFWEDSDHTILTGVIRFYDITEFKGDGTKYDIRKVEYHTVEGVWYYIMDSDGLQLDPDYQDRIDDTILSTEPNSHFTTEQIRVDNKGQIVVNSETGESEIDNIKGNWSRVPFVAFKYNIEEQSLLSWIKSLIDDYDKNTSDNSNVLQDIPNSIKVIKNYDGTNKEEFMANVALFRMMFVGEDGGVDSIDTPVEVEGHEAHLTRLRKDIFAFGNGVDNQDEHTGDPSGVALEFLYEDLASDCKNIISEFDDSLEQLLWFIKIESLNVGTGDFLNEESEIIFNTETIMNETELIDNCAKSNNMPDIVSTKTVRAKHPWVNDIEEETKRIDEDKAKAKLEEDQNMKDNLAIQASYATESSNKGGF